MVDFDSEIRNVHPINIKEIELSKYRIDDNIKKSIILYNTAIGEMKKGNFDLVIDDLKKSLSYNKDFTEAIKFLGLFYVNINDYKKAEKTFKSLYKYEMYDELINEYMESLSIKKSVSNDVMILETVDHMSNTEKVQAGTAKNLIKKSVISLLIVIIVITGVGVNYFYPKTIQGVLTKFKTISKGAEGKVQADNISDSEVDTNKKSDANESLVEEKTISNEKQENTQKNITDAKLEADNYNKDTVNMLDDAEKLLNDEMYEKAADILINMKGRNFDNQTQIRFNKLWQSLNPNPLWKIYNEGNKLYKQQNYTEALPKLIIASEINPNLDIMPWITFQIGMCYKETNDKVNALTYFNKVKNNYPKSEYVSNARMMISEIGN
ncbi:tetratricopeptide repeat protein [Clostridium sp.]|uniref:tetratricopeptide repeat protein n=1 Tax=Clostridium sp. TaxID=1506 RepID=UPI0026355A59|nr:tetratricopeptide repeat protein [Clostridium sp.]